MFHKTKIVYNSSSISSILETLSILPNAISVIGYYLMMKGFPHRFIYVIVVWPALLLSPIQCVLFVVCLFQRQQEKIIFAKIVFANSLPMIYFDPLIVIRAYLWRPYKNSNTIWKLTSHRLLETYFYLLPKHQCLIYMIF